MSLFIQHYVSNMRQTKVQTGKEGQNYFKIRNDAKKKIMKYNQVKQLLNTNWNVHDCKIKLHT